MSNIMKITHIPTNETFRVEYPTPEKLYKAKMIMKIVGKGCVHVPCDSETGKEKKLVAFKNWLTE